MQKLTLKQKAFCDYYIASGNAYQSAIEAGYSHNYAKGNINKLLGNERAKSYIDAQLKKIESKRIADAKEVQEYLTSVLRGESQSEIVLTVGIGNGYSDAIKMSKAPDEKERLKAANQLSKILGLENTIHQQQTDVPQIIFKLASDKDG